jgi:general secretion pathway protein C
MAVVLNPRAERLLARLPRVTVYSALELLLLVMIAVQCARLFWALLTPLGPVGDYKSLELMRPAPATGATLGSFDPFFRSVPGAAGQAPVVVTALDIRLYGVLANRATGGGSAIIATSNGQQRSVMVGEEIMPGVTLTGVGFDSITISRGGASEQLFLDQSPAAGAVPNSPGAAVARPPGGYQGPPPVPGQIPVPTVYAPPPPPPPTPAANQAQPLRVQQ